MSKKELNIKIDELDSAIGTFKGLQIQIGRMVDEEWEEPMGPTPFPAVATLRNWDRKLLEKYKPFYMPFCDLCCLCTFGKCDLTGDKRGACGIDQQGQQSRIVMLACCIGSATHAAHARHMLDHLIEEYGSDTKLDVVLNTKLEAPHIRLVCGYKPKTIGDLEEALDYVEKELVQLVAAAHTGQEGDNIDFESKAWHAGMLDHVALEIGDISQIAALGLPPGDPEAPMAEIGYGTIDAEKPVIMCIGHNVLPSVDIIDYLMEKDLFDEVELGGLCCTAHDMSRYNDRSKIVGPISWQLKFIKAGIPDLIVVDEQCIRTDVMVQAAGVGVPVIAASEKSCLGLPDRTHDDVDKVVDDLVSGREPGALIIEPRKVGEIAVKVAMGVRRKRGNNKKIEIGELSEIAATCRECLECVRACPNNLPIMKAMIEAKEGEYSALGELNELCVGCGRCESACPEQIPIISMISEAAQDDLLNESFPIRVGRGAIQDVEIREVGQPIVFGEIPGVVAMVGCSNYPAGYEDVADITEEFLKRRFIVAASGCSAMNIAMTKDEDGQNLYEKYPSHFDAGGLVNVGSCVSNSHITGAAIKIANIFAKRPLRGNYEEIADYIYNRVGAVGVAWGAMSQKAAAIAAGCWRLGIPVVVGPHGSKYRRMLLGDKDNEENWKVLNARDGETVYVGPAPEHMFYAAETKEEAIVLISKLVMRPNDTNKGRAVKLTHYIDLHKRHYGGMPDDLHLYVRRKQDIPFTMRDEVMTALEEKNWVEDHIGSPDPTLLDRMVRRRD
ncbi:CO dehydrogenase/acetyl-CoA synthase complex subunit epsilon [Candidatus Bathyarchaeota archaeon]|nr:CO dehydrogenase/acetyl-CoA synthase complex subunit epsilon [Candidatus Bathyarchaeota archaeon]MBT4319108.1 CO dehydrogenase/acetyl-CoA synthase complex subunit epsilon [Candidatus Bathyarchaeota archaeon]MBT4423470.1 CO dehydrogenase/acetyl-CoA synthase complex subunit epsilon [Candidatus Bathyarchaeota archaeon]MBT6605418.1 CO dehydrogenase/acetyl-CoA synthase complex subunit epsilon [Candidatus Bathyarchaeota archaeon]MBT7186349.1 CO dehydrogenase/acetyl-CoA synthase complex subunit eps